MAEPSVEVAAFRTSLFNIPSKRERTNEIIEAKWQEGYCELFWRTRDEDNLSFEDINVQDPSYAKQFEYLGIETCIMSAQPVKSGIINNRCWIQEFSIGKSKATQL